MIKIDTELSKYFITKPIHEIDIDNKLSFSDNVYMLNNEYGCILHIPNLNVRQSIKVIYKNHKFGKFMTSKTLHKLSMTDDFSKVARNIYDEMKVLNEKRLKNKKKREFKKQVNKYNL